MWLSRFLVVLIVFALSTPAQAQHSEKIPRIGYLSESNPAAFQQGLKELGYIEGKNILIEYRSAQGRIERISSLVAELVR